ncbi:GGDEF domain-containing protein [Paracoccaceae bacterium GXU_MW_L88]
MSVTETSIAVLMAEMAGYLVVPQITAEVGWRLPAIVAVVAMSIIIPGSMMEMRVGTSLREANLRLQRASHTDFLTNINNRAGFVSEATRVVDESDGNCALMLLDADYFKSINDRYGHDVGDKVLVAIADAMKFCVRRNDIIGRVGGEEFAVLLTDIDQEQTAIIAERLRSNIANLHIPSGEDEETLTATTSIGVVYMDIPSSFNVCFRVADKALYCAKGRGRNTVNIVALSDQPEADFAFPLSASQTERRRPIRLYG